YERDFPTANGTSVFHYASPGLPVHVMVGGPGNDEMESGQTRARSMKEVVEDPDPRARGADPSRARADAWRAGLERLADDGMVAVVDKEHYGIALVRANRTALGLEYVQTTDGVVFDSFTLTK
ncbi:hypothetical protein TeGR_g3468, partial [Tetraparma gracilis]